MKKVFLAIAILAVSTAAFALDFGDILKEAGTSILAGKAVDAMSDPINDFINTLTFNKGVGSSESTKVVPLLSFGDGRRLGFAQVSGPSDVVDETEVVWALQFTGRWNGQVFIPSDTANPLRGIRRVQGVGVSAVVNYKL